MGFENNLAQIIIMTRKCVDNKNHVTRSEVKVSVRTLHLCIGLSKTCPCPTHNFVMHGKISSLFFGTNDHHDKTMCWEKKLCQQVKDRGHSPHLNFVQRLW